MRRTKSLQIHILKPIYNRIFERTGAIRDGAVRDLTSRVTASLTWGLCGFTLLGTMGVDTSALLTGLGVGGAALGFAARDIGANFMAGVIMAVDRNRTFGQGTRIRVGQGPQASEGVVTHWSLRHLTLRNVHGERVLIPNSLVFTSVITLRNEPDKERSFTPEKPFDQRINTGIPAIDRLNPFSDGSAQKSDFTGQTKKK